MLSMPEIIKNKIEPLVATSDRIAIMVSGGIDSAVLSHLVVQALCKRTSAWTLTFVTVPKFDGSITHAKRVIDRISSYTHLYPPLARGQYDHVIMGNPYLHHSQQTISGMKAFLEQRPDIDLVLNGANRTPNELPGGPVRFNTEHPRVRLPFFALTKDQIVRYAIENGLAPLLAITHSCTEQEIGRCYACWQCKERAWAFNQIGYTDPGAM